MDIIKRRKFGPMSADHPSVDEPCAACGVPFKGGDYTTLIVLGPGPSQENQKKAREGKAYTGIAAHVHWTCATGENYEKVDS